MGTKWIGPAVAGAAFAASAIVMWLILSRGGTNGAPPTGIITGLAGGLTIVIALTVFNRSALRKSRAAAARHPGKVTFSILPFVPVRTQITALRRALGEQGSEPRYGYARPFVVVDADALRLLMNGEESSEFLSIPRSAITSVTGDQLKVGFSRFGTIAVGIALGSEVLRLDLSPCDPNNVTAKAPAEYFQTLLGQLQADLVTA